MSEIKCNKLEITSLRQCDSIKIRGNIGPCIIEGPARQGSCQGCQPGCSYWIWPVTHTQISPVKITGYIDFLFLFVSAWECAYLGLCASIIVSASLDRNVCVCVCVCIFYATVLKHARFLQEQGINQVCTHLGRQNLRVGPSVCVGYGKLHRNTQTTLSSDMAVIL